MSRVITLTYFILISLSLSVNAESVYLKEEISTAVKAQYTLRKDIITLVSLSTQSAPKASKALKKTTQTNKPLNLAEQYLILLAKANIQQRRQQHQQVIQLLKQAKLLRGSIAEQQLNTPLFSNLHLVLAKSLAATKNYEKAYQEKKTYVDEFNDYSEAKREDTLEQLTLKYKVVGKNRENVLLNNQNKLKALQVSAVEKQQVQQQRYFMLIAATLFVFILLFLRQLKVRKKLLLLAKTDSLTGLLNRSALFYQGHKLLQESLEQQQNFSVLLFDIDHFKLVNDDYGHQVGDAILVEIAILTAETMRSRDVLARLGGEEFVALLPNTDINKAKAIATRILEKIAHHAFGELLNERNNGESHHITLSIGVANINDTSNVFDDVLHAADSAMYQAKAQGRNQMVSYSSIAKDQERRQR